MVVGKARNKSANEVTRVILELLSPLKDYVHTITYDNGKKFSYRTKIFQKLCAISYFTPLYHSWGRGLNENTNGLLRQFFSKGVSFEKTTQEDIVTAMCRLNWRLKKCLGFKNPYNTFLDYANQ